MHILNVADLPAMLWDTLLNFRHEEVPSMGVVRVNGRCGSFVVQWKVKERAPIRKNVCSYLVPANARWGRLHVPHDQLWRWLRSNSVLCAVYGERHKITASLGILGHTQPSEIARSAVDHFQYMPRSASLSEARHGGCFVVVAWFPHPVRPGAPSPAALAAQNRGRCQPCTPLG